MKSTPAIAGCGAVTALGLGLPPLQRAVNHSQSGLQPREYAVGKSHCRIVAGAVPEGNLRQLRDADPDHGDSRAYLFAAAALRQAREELDPQGLSVPASRRALVLSTTKANIEALEALVRGHPMSPVATRHLQPALLAADLANLCDARGPVQCVSTACVSGLMALQQGVALIRRREADLVFVTGVDVISHFVLAGFTALKSMDPEGCRPFDKDRIGLSLGEGAGVVVLVRGESIGSPIVTVTGWGTSNDANHLTGPSRDGGGLALAMRRALDKAGVAPDGIDYIHAHGTGTPYNDSMESLALRQIFGDCVPPVGSSKGMLGHTLGAAGVLETILCHAALRAGVLPGTPRLREPDPVAPKSLLRLPRSAPECRRILKINCGFGGVNGALVLERIVS